MTIGDWALLLGLALNAVVVGWGMWRIARNVEVVHVSTNSRMDELLAVAKEAAMAAGLKQGREESAREK